MEKGVVCISGADGAGAQEIAQLVAQRLGIPLIDEGIVERAAREAGVDTHVVSDVEQRKSFLARILDDLNPGATAATGYAFAGFVPPAPHEPHLASDDLRSLIRTAIEETASRGDAVIVAHAASFALANRDDVLRVLVTASGETRRRRLTEALGLDEDEAAKRLKEGDAGRADYLKRFYGIADELPTHYDVVVNTDRLTPQAAARVVAEATDG